MNLNRLVGKIEDDPNGPSLLVVGGIHGNEASGVLALERVVNDLKSKSLSLRGNFYAIKGNIAALEKTQRFVDQDLNRLWHQDTIDKIENGTFEARISEEKEMEELYLLFKSITSKNTGPFYFIDLHTTSAETIPFLTVNDSLLNRSFTVHYPLPIVLGIEEYIQGPVLSYINELGYVAFGFEAGQHDDPLSIDNHYHFTFMSLYLALLLPKDYPLQNHMDALEENSKGVKGFYEILSRFAIKDQDDFQMKDHFQNFETIAINTHLANYNGEKVLAKENALIFMPLYQKQGNDGFFTMRKIPQFFMSLSATLRRLKFDSILTLLPGVSWFQEEKSTLIVNRKVAKFLTKSIFHLLGYRARKLDRNHWIMSNREWASRHSDYKLVDWK